MTPFGSEMPLGLQVEIQHKTRWNEIHIPVTETISASKASKNVGPGVARVKICHDHTF